MDILHLNLSTGQVTSSRSSSKCTLPVHSQHLHNHCTCDGSMRSGRLAKYRVRRKASFRREKFDAVMNAEQLRSTPYGADLREAAEGRARAQRRVLSVD